MCLLYKGLLVPLGWMDVAVKPIRAKIEGFGVDTLWAYAALGVFYSLIHSFLEEYYWRWFVFAQLRRLVTVPMAVVISSLGFMAHHVLLLGTFFGWDSPLTWTFSVAVAIGGAVWAWLYHRFDSLYPVWLGHLLVDAGIFWIGYDLMRGMF
jgi:membrane protease YdiL (CAAX protease family)